MKRTNKSLTKMITKLKELGSKAVEFGIINPEAGDIATSENKPASGTNNPITMGELANIMERGRTYIHKTGVTLVRGSKSVNIPAGTLIHIPARPFLAPTILSKQSDVFRDHEDEFQSLCFAGTKPNTLLAKQGRYMVKAMRDIIKDGDFEELSYITRLLKGKDTKLIDSGRLLKSISFKIVDK